MKHIEILSIILCGTKAGKIIMEQKNSVQSITRAFDILEKLSSNPKGLPLTDLSNRLSLHKSTVYRILSALQERRYVEKEGTTYKLGLEFIHLASQYLNSLELKTEAEPFLKELSGKTGQTVFMAIREKDEIVYIDKVEQFNSLRRYSIIGTRQPLYCTSLGRAFLMNESDDDLSKTLSRLTLERRTPHTITRPEELMELLRDFRNRGWTEDNEENETGVRCAGAPLFDYRGKVAAAISTVWDAQNSPADPEKTGRMIKKTAELISERLGWIPG